MRAQDAENYCIVAQGSPKVYAAPLAVKTEEGRIVDLWKEEMEGSFPTLLAQHEDLCLYGLFHQLLVWFLYPPRCSCKGVCPCDAFREQVALSFHLELYNRAEGKRQRAGRLSTMRFLFQIPDDHTLRRNHGQSYPLWLAGKEWQAKTIDLKAVASLIEALLRLGCTYEIGCGPHPLASIREAIGLILGKVPLKSKKGKQGRDAYLCGEKRYSASFNAYKPICHFVLAYQHVFGDNPPPVPGGVDKIRKFFGLAQWVREQLLRLQTPNIKGRSLFAKDALLLLPSWVETENMEIPLAPFDEKLESISEQIKRTTPQVLERFERKREKFHIFGSGNKEGIQNAAHFLPDPVGVKPI